ncbi:hypothetical protein BBD39_10985 [Arsenophonus endosymbiont of Bemisia tabaci Asia II 3]|nr:hypothetical protein BBD39_10985 [Arsenophonus endosymbiont of Bemisia tabaci Asia II 3]
MVIVKMEYTCGSDISKFMLNSVELQTELLDLIACVSSNRFGELISTLSNWILPVFIYSCY